MSYLKIVRFLQLTAELLIGAEGRAFIVHLTPNHYLLYGLAANPGSVRPTAPGHGRRRGPVPSTHLQKPSCPEPLPRIRKRHAPWPDEPLIPAHLDRERNRRWAEHCGSVNEIGAFAWFMVPRWSASAHVCCGNCDRASTDEWSPTKASGSARTSLIAGLFLFDTVPDMSNQWCPA